ncbi:tetratricopeptide repeat protein [Microbispora sp. H13382]|uniref:tetratricopeptide repeat protein n=1 Tax=Microbispora sp. H13382 TaxID=2729112 RepID=UPI001601C93F|nr:tetratricopeptide repeat protein [Microbispora sp. H13382]
MRFKGWRRIAYGAFVIVALALMAVVGIRTGWWEDSKDGKGPGWVWLERGSWIAGILGGFIGYLSWRLSAKAPVVGEPGSGIVRNDSDVQPGTLPSADAGGVTGGSAQGRHELLDRRDARQELRTMLLNGPWGVIVVRGEPGMGKSKLVKVVLEDLKRTAQGQDHLRICEHEAIPGVRLDVKTLIDDLEGTIGPTSDIRPGESSLARFEAALEALNEAPVLITIECAENLVDRNSKHIVDYDLDEAFEILANRRHRVTVLLVTRLSPKSPGSGTWPARAHVVSVQGLPYEDFVTYLRELDRDDVLHLDRFPGALVFFHDKLQGNLRLAELLFAILLGDGMDIGTLQRELTSLKPKEVPQCLSDLLIRGLKPSHRRVLEVLAAYAMPVEPAAVAELVAGELSADEVSGALNVLQGRHIVHRTSDERYCLPSSEVDWLPEDDTAWSNLLLAAADALWRRAPNDPSGIHDLQLHIAAVNALLRAGLQGLAYMRMEFIDRVLRKWNCPFLLIEQREAVRGAIGDGHTEMANENALGDLYIRRGQSIKAAQAYHKALEYSEILNDTRSRTKIRANMGMMYWQRNQIEEACQAYNLVLEEARNEGDLRVQLSAFEGLADCHRRWGRYDEAIAFAQQALAVPGLLEYPHSADARAYASSRTVKMALKLSRWHAELGHEADSRRFLNIAEEEVAGHRDDWLRVACLDGYADWLLGRYDITGAIKAATTAVEKALQVHDPVVLLQARTTLCFAHLVRGDYRGAAHAIEGADRYRQVSRSLIVLALHALVARHQWSDKASRLFGQLHKEAAERLRLDERDFAAWYFTAFAICGRRLDDSADLSKAVEAFRKARSLPTRPTPGLVQRMSTLLWELDKTAQRPGRLVPVIEVVNAG